MFIDRAVPGIDDGSLYIVNMRMTFLRVIYGVFVLLATLPVCGHALANDINSDPLPGMNSQIPILSWEDYWQRVEDTQRVIQEAEKLPPDQVGNRLNKIIPQWEATISVKLPDGSVITVAHSFLASLLRATPPDLGRIDRVLAAMVAERDALVQGKVAANDLAALNRILARPEFQWNESYYTQPNAFVKFWQHIQGELGKLGRALFGFTGANYVIGIGAVILLMFMLLFLFRNLIFGFVSEANLAPDTQAGNEILTADTALHKAYDLSRGGDNRSAVRYLYLSALLLLEEHGLLAYDRTKTNREYLRSVSNFPELETPLRHVVEVFDRVWYGYQPIDDREYLFYERQVVKLRQQRQLVEQKSETE
jgi:Domain of unknown function (DUF4129)